MPIIPSITIFVRHSEDCPNAGDEFYKRCACRKHLRWFWKGKQHRKSAKTRSWTKAESEKRRLEAQYEAAELGKPVRSDEPVTVEQSIAAFLNEKRGGQAAQNTLAKYELTLSRLQDFCIAKDIYFLNQITLEHLSTWRATWDQYYSSSFALRNSQSRLRAFFRYCENARWITYNPARALSAIKIRDEDYVVDPFTEAQVNKIIASIDKCEDISASSRERCRLVMLLQRWSGLSLVDAVCLSREEVVVSGKRYRIDTSRRKTGTKVSVPIPPWFGKELVRFSKGKSGYLFWTGESTPKSAVSVYDKLYRKVFARAGVHDGSSHRFRHRFAVAALESGVDIRVVSKCLGHKSLPTTERFYAKWNVKQQATLENELARTW